MKNFIFKSQTPSTYKKLFQSIETIQKNVLYLTYRIDTILKNTNKLVVDKSLQTQVSDFYEESPDISTGRQEDIPEETQE